MNGHSDPIEILRGLTTQAAEEAALTQNRGNDRSPVMAWRNGLIPQNGIELTTNRFGDSCVRVTVRGATIIKATTPMMADEFTFVMRIPKGRDGQPAAQLDSEYNQHVASGTACNAAITNLLDLRGRTIDADERVHKFSIRKNTGLPKLDENGNQQTDKQGRLQTIWEDSEGQSRYYHITAVAGTVAATGQPSAGPAGATIAAARGYLEAGTEGRSKPQQLKDLQAVGIDFTDRANSELQAAVVNGTLAEYLAAFAEPVAVS